MTDRRWSIVGIFVATAILVASLPISLISVDSYFGLGSFLVVSAFSVSLWLMLSAGEGRGGAWFRFAFVLGFCLPHCPLIELGLSNIAVYLQRLTQRGVLSLSQRVIEPVELLLIAVCPFAAACLLSFVFGIRVRKTMRFGNRLDSSDAPANVRWRFSIREMLIAVAAFSLLGAWIASRTHQWTWHTTAYQIAFLQRFKDSFRSGEVELLAEPQLEEIQRNRMREYGRFAFRPPGVNEYRVVAPIRVKGNVLWAVWAYTCNEEANDFIYEHAYVVAPVEQQLPQFPYPAQRYIDGAWEMVDGIPTTAGPSATVTSVTSPAVAGALLVLTASTPKGTVCELQLFPADVLSPLPRQSPDKNGVVKWSWNVPLDSAGWGISYELRCIQSRGSEQLVSTTRGSIHIVAPQRPKQ